MKDMLYSTLITLIVIITFSTISSAQEDPQQGESHQKTSDRFMRPYMRINRQLYVSNLTAKYLDTFGFYMVFYGIQTLYSIRS